MTDSNPSIAFRSTVAEALGQIVWLFSQSPVHRTARIADLETTVMPAILTEQFRIFRFGALAGLEVAGDGPLAAFTRDGLERMPLGVALWAQVSEAVEEKIERGERLTGDDWRSGDRLWLLELITPFATPENHLAAAMFADLVQGPFLGRRFSMHRTDPQTGTRERFDLGGDTGADA